MVAGGSDATSSLLLRSGFHKRLRPVHEENRRLKAEVRALRTDNSQLRTSLAASLSAPPQHQRHGGGGSLAAALGGSQQQRGGAGGGTPSPYRTVSPTLGFGVGGSNTTAMLNQTDISAVGGNNNNSTVNNTNAASYYTEADAAIAVHSPLQWELETAAAINARTRYSPHQDEAARARRAANRRAESVAHLVARLHDKSCDERAKRLAGYEVAVKAENERYAEQKTLSHDEQRELGTRLHDVSSGKKKEMLATLERSLYPPKERRTFDAEAIAKSNDRIYREPMEKKQKGLEKLLQTYVYDHEDRLPKVRLSKDQQQAMADRLSQRANQ